MLADPSRNVSGWFDDGLRTATLLGLASIPGTIALNWGSDTSVVSIEALALACVLTGYLYADRELAVTDAGAQTALMGLIGVVGLWTVEIAGLPWAEDSTGTLVWAVIVPIGFVIVTLLVILVGGACGYVGGWIHGLADRVRPTGS